MNRSHHSARFHSEKILSARNICPRRISSNGCVSVILSPECGLDVNHAAESVKPDRVKYGYIVGETRSGVDCIGWRMSVQ